MKITIPFLKSGIVLTLVLTATIFPVSASEDDGVSANSVSFGTSYAQTGVASPGIASYYSGISAYFSFVNENGGVYGRKLNLIKKDDQGVVTQSISRTNELILADKIFGLISNSPSCPNQLAVAKSINVARREIPNLFVDCYLQTTGVQSEELGSDSTNFYNSVSKSAQMKILKTYVESSLPNQKVALIYQSDEHKLAVENLLTDSKIVCRNSFIAGVNFGSIGCNSDSNPLQNGDVVIYAGAASGLARLIATYSSGEKKLTLKYFVNEDAFNPTLLSLAGVPKEIWSNIYSVSNNYLLSDSSSPAVVKLASIAKGYASNEAIDQRFLNGMNVGYIISSTLAAVGPELTRARFMKALEAYGSSFDVLGLSERSSVSSMRFLPLGGVVVKHGASGDQAISDVYTIDQGKVLISQKKNIQITSTGLPLLVQRLLADKPSPNPTSTLNSPKPSSSPVASPITSSKQSIAETQILELDGEEEEPFGKIQVKRDKSKYLIQITSNLPDEDIQIRATKKGQKTIVFRVSTNDQGFAKFSTTRALSGFQLTLFLDGEVLNFIKVG